LVSVRRVYEATDSTLKQVRVVMRTGLTKAALEFAIDSGWVMVESEHDVSLGHALASGILLVLATKTAALARNTSGRILPKLELGLRPKFN